MVPRHRSAKALFAAGVAALAVVAPAADDELNLELAGGRRQSAQITVAIDAAPGTPHGSTATVKEVLLADLTASGSLQPRSSPGAADLILHGTLSSAGERLSLAVSVADGRSRQVLMARTYGSSTDLARGLAHAVADDLVRLVSGHSGPFLSRIAWTSDRAEQPEIWVMDWDGAGQRSVLRFAGEPAGHAWSPDGSQLAAAEMLPSGGRLLLVNLAGRTTTTLVEGRQMVSSPTFSPAGDRILFAAATDGNTDLYSIATAGGPTTRLTTARAIDTRPAWSPTSPQVVFTSSRSGTPQLMLMQPDGAGLRALTFGAAYTDEARWLPDGVRLVCTRRIDGRFQLGVVDALSGSFELWPAPGNNETPEPSPGGAMVAFTSDRTGTPQIWLRDATGRERQLTATGANHSPAWVSLHPASP